MPSALSVWLEFAAALVAIVVAGGRLARYGDVIGDRTGLGGSWIGLMLIATVTSLPELVTGVSAVVLANDTDIAVGALLGSCVFNLVILVLIDVLLGGRSIFARVRAGHSLAAFYGAVLIATAALPLALGITRPIGSLGVGTFAILILYPLFMRSLFIRERDDMMEMPETGESSDPVALRDAVIRCWLAAIVVIVVGAWLPFVGERMALVLGVNETFVGTLFVAFATSLPEVVVSVAAVRIGAVDMAVANILGSNLFNMLILVPEDLVHLSGPILAAVSPLHLGSAAAALLMNAVVLVALRWPPRGRWGPTTSWAGFALVAIYLANAFVLFRANGS